MQKTIYKIAAANMLKTELIKRNMSYDNLVDLLNQHGKKTNRAALTAKMYRGAFSFPFFLECMSVLGVKTIRISEDFFQTLSDKKVGY